MELIDDIKIRLSISTNLYDNLRVVDPLNKKIILDDSKEITQLEGTCYDLWEKHEFCNNCISRRALIESDSCVKIEL